MKNTFKVLFAFGVMGLVMTGCKTEPGNTAPEKGEKSTVTLTIRNASNLTRGAVAEENATAVESNIVNTTGIKVVVFNEDGSLDYTSGDTNVTLNPAVSDVYTSGSFTVTSGTKYFFVFANDPASGGKITMPAAGSNIQMSQFMEQVVAVSRTAGRPDITTDDSFLLGTLWAEKKLAAGGGTDASPVNVELSIGRAGAKICVADIDTDNTPLAGTFSDAGYRIGSLPKKIHTVGVHTGTNLPIGNHGVLVTSAVHSAAPLTLPTDANFERYYSDTFSPEATAFYTTENTTALDVTTGQQFYGNTTYIQIQTKYTPASAEIYDPATLTAGATLTGDTFWVGYKKDGTRLIFNALPTTGDHADIDYNLSFAEYTGGLNYHKFPVYDKNETGGIVYRNRVLRNHYYEFSITKFNDLGSHEKDVKPTEPIDAPTTVTVDVTVKKWNKVSDDNVEV